MLSSPGPHLEPRELVEERERPQLVLQLGRPEVVDVVAEVEHLGISKFNMFFCNFYKFLAGSFSAVSKPNFARKYAFDSIFQALQDLHPFAPLQSQNFRKKSV